MAQLLCRAAVPSSQVGPRLGKNLTYALCAFIIFIHCDTPEMTEGSVKPWRRTAHSDICLLTSSKTGKWGIQESRFTVQTHATLNLELNPGRGML